jgi:microcystin degradation protein MlrC
MSNSIDKINDGSRWLFGGTLRAVRLVESGEAMRIAIGEFKQETNTFARTPTELEHFRNFHLWYGDEVITNSRDTNCEIAGFIDVCEAAGHELLPTMAAFALSSGAVTQAAYQTLRDELLARLAALQPFDAVLLALHGAMVVEGEDDPDGATIEAVRELIGPGTPFVVSMDLHANVTRRCVEHADAIVGFRTSPHIDLRDTGQRAAQVLVRWLAGEVRPVMAAVKIPMVTPASTHVHSLPGPFQRLMQASAALEQNGVLSTTVFTVQPWLDIEEMGFATVAVTDGDQGLAERVAAQLAEQAWFERDAFMEISLAAPAAAIARALAHDSGPVVLSDLADGTGAGSPGDATAVIAALLEADPPRTALVCVRDPEAVERAIAAGVGGAFDADVGGKLDNVYNQPVRYTGIVEFAGPASFRFAGGGYTGVEMEMGPSAVVRHNNIHLLITSRSVFTVDPEMYRAVGLEPSDAQIVVVKSHIQFRAGYDPIAKEIILLDTPGMSADHLDQFEWRKVPRPLFPFDRTIAFTPSPMA